MRRLLRWLEAAFAATAFAEEGDADTARHMIAEAEHGADRPAPGTQAAPQRPRRPGAPAVPSARRA